MALTYQVTVDSADPHPQAAWWARTLEWRVEPTDEAFIRRMIAEGLATEADTVEFEGQLWWRDAAISHPDGAEGGAGSRILFQKVPEPKSGKTRIHLDIRVPAARFDAAVAELIERGATELHRNSQGPYDWVTMADPEGNEFCVARAR